MGMEQFMIVHNSILLAHIFEKEECLIYILVNYFEHTIA